MLLMTPGPTRVPDRVLQAGAGAMLHHRTPEFSKILTTTLNRIRPLFGTRGDVLPVHSTGRGAMEASICNLFSPGDEIVSVCNGKFGAYWARLGDLYGLTVHRVCTDWSRPGDPEAVRRALAEHPKSRAVTVAFSDTSNGVLNDVKAIAEVAGDALLLVDGVSSIGGVRFEMEAWGVDIAVTASQKCLMSSPGLAFVAISDRAWKATESSKLPRLYFDFPAIREALGGERPETPGTTPVHLVMQVNEALTLIHEEGLDAVFERHLAMAQQVRDFGLPMTCPEFPSYSPTMTSLRVDDPKGVRRKMQEQGILIAVGLGDFVENSVRIGHMGDIRPGDVERTLEALRSLL